MELHGKNIIAGKAVEVGGKTFQAFAPASGKSIEPHFEGATADQVNQALEAAESAFHEYRRLSPERRANFLEKIADEILALGDALIERAHSESGLLKDRLTGERGRTVNQLRMFADLIREGSWVDARIDRAIPDRQPLPKPDLRRMLTPIGPVVVFGACNFPLAFSIAGGDTASALAAGCPVVVKAHPGHPGLAQLCGRIVAEALAAVDAPAGTHAVVHGLEAGQALVVHRAIAAASFTGSLAGGRALFDLACARPDPIPFYGELGSLNPVVVTPGAVASRGAEIARGFVDSFTLGSGQFCTKPGLLFLPEGHGLESALVDRLRAVGIGPLLNERVFVRYGRSATALAATPGVRSLVAGSTVDGSGFGATPSLFAVGATHLVAQADALLEECFGPAALIVEYGSTDELAAALTAVPGALTAALHADLPDEAGLARALLTGFAARSGRIIWNGWPTGVAVTWAQHHGGPWPATTSPLHTSVGVAAVR